MRLTRSPSAAKLTSGFSFGKNLPASVAKRRRRIGGLVAGALIGASAIGLNRLHTNEVARLKASPAPIKEIARIDLNNGREPSVDQIRRVSETIRRNWKDYKAKGLDKLLRDLQEEREGAPKRGDEYNSLTRTIWVMRHFGEFDDSARRESAGYLGLK